MCLFWFLFFVRRTFFGFYPTSVSLSLCVFFVLNSFQWSDRVLNLFFFMSIVTFTLMWKMSIRDKKKLLICVCMYVWRFYFMSMYEFWFVVAIFFFSFFLLCPFRCWIFVCLFTICFYCCVCIFCRWSVWFSGNLYRHRVNSHWFGAVGWFKCIHIQTLFTALQNSFGCARVNEREVVEINK